MHINRNIKKGFLLLIILGISQLVFANKFIINKNKYFIIDDTNICPEYNSKNISSFLEDSTKKRVLPKNSFYIELLGSTIIGSLNYEKILFANRFNAINFRISFGVFPSTPITYLVPIQVNYLAKLANFVCYEIGFGYRFGFRDIIVNTGFRFLIKNHFLIRINFTPELYSLKKWEIGFKYEPWGGISFGYSFGK